MTGLGTNAVSCRGGFGGYTSICTVASAQNYPYGDLPRSQFNLASKRNRKNHLAQLPTESEPTATISAAYFLFWGRYDADAA
jgi:hypothetical protein